MGDALGEDFPYLFFMPSVYTVADLLARGYELTAYCRNHKCERNKKPATGVPKAPKWVTLDLSTYPPMTPVDDIEARLRCSVCKGKDVLLQVTPGEDVPGAGSPTNRPME